MKKNCGCISKYRRHSSATFTAMYMPTPIAECQKTERQSKQYILLTELQKMTREIPLNFQQRIPCSLLSSLASSLLDETVFEIVLHLKEIQQMTERKLMEQRANLHKSHKAQKIDMQKKQEEALNACVARPHNLPLVKKQIEEETQALEVKIKDEVQKDG
ncbi:Protein DGCR6L [Holothuria leucospilota]|uniref:Protein DGCR6L n=1 Tax=Holothuria leucospilota TaxID=206669 RepID=A0A9Q1CK17_HOLLE|nr:Protein DGCR6L [Holothuria leucospilota]